MKIAYRVVVAILLLSAVCQAIGPSVASVRAASGDLQGAPYAGNWPQGQEQADPVEVAKKFMQETPAFWNPLGYWTTVVVYTIGVAGATGGVGYLLLESPKLTVSLVSGGLVGLGVAVAP